MNSHSCETATSSNPMAATPSRPVVLELKGLGPVPSLKNHKRSIIQQNGKPRPITDPGVKNWMECAIEAFESQLLCASQKNGGGMLTVASRRCLIASCVPADDCWTQVPEISVKCELCDPGQEGATIIIEKL